MARIAKSSIDEVVAAADMLDVVSQYTQLRKAGANYSGLCPFHQEKTPSFSVDPLEKLYYCFGCGEGGDLLSFVQKKENLDFAQAVEHLADRYGVRLEYEEPGPGDAARKRRDRLRKLLEQACAYYERVLWEARAAEAARAYLAQRGLGEDVCKAFRLGFSLPAWDKLRDAAQGKGFESRDLLDAGLVVPGKRDAPYDRFRGRLMFPLADDRGRVLGFGARTLGDDKPKYLNSPETPLYHKSEALFGLDRAKAAAGREDRLFVVEGYTDVLALAQAGVENCVASMGTALTEEQLKRMVRVTRNLLLCFDADAAGIGAMQRALELGRRLGIALSVVRVPDGLDPADFILSGKDGAAFRALADDAQTLLQFQVRTVLSSHDLTSVDGRTRAFAVLGGVLAEAAGPLERDEEMRYVADRLQLSEENVRFLLSERSRPGGRAAGAGRPAGGLRPGGDRPVPAEERLLMGTHELEVRFLAACLAVPDKGREYLDALDEGYFASEASRLAYGAVKARLNPSHAGKTLQEQGTAEDLAGEAAGVMAEVVLRAAQEALGERVTKELFLRVQDAHVGRVIAKLKVAVARDETGVDEARLMEFQRTRRRIRQAIRAIPLDE